MASDGNPGLGGRVAENSGINPTVLLTLRSTYACWRLQYRSHAIQLSISSHIFCKCNFSENPPVMCSVATIKADCAMKIGHKHGRVAEACSLATGGEDATGLTSLLNIYCVP